MAKSEPTPRLDVERLRSIRMRRGTSARELSLSAGRDQGYVSRLERGEVQRPDDVGLSGVVSMAASLEVPVEALLRNSGAGWQIGSWLNPAPVERFLAEMRDAQSCITCTQGVESYLLPDEMAIFLGCRFHERMGYDEHRLSRWLDWATGYRHAQHALRRSAEFAHRVIAPDRDFRDPIVQERDWVEIAARIVDQYEDLTAVGFVPPEPFRDLTWVIADIIGIPNWDKVTVVDDLVALVRPSRDVYLVTYQPDTVEHLHDVLDRVAGTFVPYAFPSGGNLTLTRYRETSKQAVRYLQRLAKPR